MPFHSKILHIIDDFTPMERGQELGWRMTQRMRACIGERIVASLADEHPDAVVLFSDADEIPSPESIQWLAQHCCSPGITFEFATTMPTFMYNFVWLSSPYGYSTVTARSMQDEKHFWQLRMSGEEYYQTLMPIPFYPSGWHCSYCFTSDLCVEKLRHANLADGPPYLGLFTWTTNLFDALRACGVAPQGHALSKRPDLSEISLPTLSKNTYPYLFVDAVCTASMREEIQAQLASMQ